MVRLRQPNGPLIRELSAKRDWSLAQLAAKADIKRETARRAWDGEGVLRCTMVAIATALGVDYRSLLQPSDSEAAAPLPRSELGKKKLLLTFSIEGDAEVIAELGIVETLNRLVVEIKSKATLEPLTYRVGSVHVVVPVSVRDACASIRALAAGRLDKLNIVSIMLPPRGFFLLRPALLLEFLIRLVPLRLAGGISGLFALLCAPLFFEHPPWTLVIPPAQLPGWGKTLWSGGIAIAVIIIIWAWVRRGIRVFWVSETPYIVRASRSIRLPLEIAIADTQNNQNITAG